MICQKLTPAYLTHVSCDICHKNNIYSAIYREIGTFLHILTPAFVPLWPQNKVNLGDISNHVTFPSYQPLMWPLPQQWYLYCDWSGDGHVLTHFDPFFCPFTHPKQSKFGWYMKPCHLYIFPVSHVTFAPKMIFILWFIGRWARLDPFWPPFLTLYAPKTR